MTARAAIVFAAGRQTGLGHARRAIVLADALAREGFVTTLYSTDPQHVSVLGRGAVRPWTGTPLDDDVVVIDGYSFDVARIRASARRGACLVAIDDIGDRPMPADLVVNPNLYGADIAYPLAKAVLAGPAYALIDPAFAALPAPPSPGRALVSFGGSAVASKAVPLAAALAARLDRSIDLALPEPSDVPASAVTVHCGVDLAALMAGADIFIGGLGVSFSEALVARRRVVGVCLADNQRLALAAARVRGLSAIDRFDIAAIVAAAETSLASPPPQLAELDGQGAQRVAGHVLRQFA